MEFSRDAEIDVLREAVKIHAPSWQEGPVVALLDKVFEGTSARKVVDRVGNVRYIAGSGSPVILLASHLDTIDEPMPFREDKDALWGRGAVDCRASLVSMALAMRRRLNRALLGTLVFGGIVAEETSTAGVEAFLEGDLVPDFVIFGEPTNLHRVCIAYKGRILVKVSVKSSPGHVAAAWIFHNSIEIAWDFYEALKHRLAAIVKHRELTPFHSPRATATTIHGGSTPNVMPDAAVIDIDVRFPPSIKKETVISVLQEIRGETLAKHASDEKMNGEVIIDLSIESASDGIRVSTDNQLCVELAKAIKEVTGGEPRFVKKTGTTFMNQIGNTYACPIVTYGPGDPSLEHTQEERIDKQEFLQAIDVLVRVIDGLWNG